MFAAHSGIVSVHICELPISGPLRAPVAPEAQTARRNFAGLATFDATIYFPHHSSLSVEPFVVHTNSYADRWETRSDKMLRFLKFQRNFDPNILSTNVAV
jgi:hypothetical protein